MRIQLQEQSLRLRVDEDELQVLLDGGTLQAPTAIGHAFELCFVLTLAERAAIDGTPSRCTMQLPRGDVMNLAARLPSREGLSLQVDGLSMVFDVDVRDSARRRQRERG